jgi:DNA-binding Xre family transcriptional regulator
VLAEVLLELEATALERGLAQVLAEQRVRVQELAQALGLEQVQVRALALVAQQVELQVQVQEEE